MFPAPTTIASSTACCWTSTICPAMASIRSRSRPYSLAPISASPESFRRMRPNTACAGSETTSSEPAVVTLVPLTELKPLELEHLGALVAEDLAHRFRRFVDPGLLCQHLFGEETLVQHSLDDLLVCLLWLRLHLVGVRVDLALGRDDLLRHVLAADPARSGWRSDVH